MGAYFTVEELCKSDTAKRNNIANEPNGETLANLNRLIEELLDPIRMMWKNPIHVNSGYRCYRLNKMVGGSTTSQHLLGEAADITTGTIEGNEKLFKMIVNSNLLYDQIINEFDYKWIHISYKGKIVSNNRKQVLKSVKNSKGKTVYCKA